MRRRIELRETVIAPGAIVRLKREWATCLKDKVARWEVLAMADGGTIADVADVEDRDDTRCFLIDHLERVSGGQEEAVGFTWVKEEDEIVTTDDESYVDDPFDDADTAVEVPSLFDDPITLQLEEDKDDPDFEAGGDA